MLLAAASQPDTAVCITITDSTCHCSSPSRKQFNCAALLRKVPRAETRADKRKKGVTPPNYRNRTFTAVRRHLDSLGYFHPVIDTTLPLWSLIPGNRATVTGEVIVCNPSSAADSLLLPPPDPETYPYDAAITARRAKELVRVFTDNGHPFASVTVDLRPTGSPDTLMALYHITPENRYRFAAPRLKGTYTTSERLLRHDLAVQAGALFDHRAIVNSIERLESRSYIASVAALPVTVTTDTSGDGITVPFFITDRSGLGLDGAAALEAQTGEAPRINGEVQFNFTNLFHAGEEALLTYTGDRSRQRLDLRFARPWLLGLSFTTDAGGGLEVVSDEFGYLYGKLGFFLEPALWWQTGVNLMAHNVSRKDTTAGGSNTFTGADLVLIRKGEPPGDGRWSRELSIATGSGFTRKERTYNRSHIDFSAGVHLPLPAHLALQLRGVSGHIISRESNLVAAELYRVGGNRSLRGYREDEFAFRSVLYGQMEVLYYFQAQAAVFLFSDGGLGFTAPPGPDVPYSKLLGYGIGIRIPAGIGMIAIEWARNIRDTRSPGRLHVGFSNRFAAATRTTALPIGTP